MPLTIPFYSTGIQVNEYRTNSPAYLHGVQSIDISSNIVSIKINDEGRSQKKQIQVPVDNEISVERVLGTHDEDDAYITGPLLDSYFYALPNAYGSYSVPTTYRSWHFLNPVNFGYARTGAQATDMYEFGFNIAYKDDSFISGSSTIKNLNIKRSLLSSYSLSIEPNAPLKETSRFVGGYYYLNDDTFTKNLAESEVTTTPSFKIIRGDSFSKSLSVLPTTLTSLINNSASVDGSAVYGIKGITCDLSLSYKSIPDEGNFRGLSNNSEINLWKSLEIPISISCSFDITAQKYFQYDIKEINSFGDEQIILVFNIQPFTIGSTTLNYFVINLGKKNLISSIERGGPNISGDLTNYKITYSNSNNDFGYYFTTNTNFTSVDQTTEKY